MNHRKPAHAVVSVLSHRITKVNHLAGKSGVCFPHQATMRNRNDFGAAVKGPCEPVRAAAEAL